MKRDTETPSPKWPKVAVGVAILGAVVVSIVLLPVGHWLLTLVQWIRGAGAVGAAGFGVVYVTVAVLLLPASVLTLGAGFAYGPLLGTLLVSPVSVLAASAAFLIARYGARDWIAKRVAGDVRFLAIDEAIGESGFKIVVLLRLSPLIPFNLLNYALGLTKVRFRDYLLGSFLGMIPGTALYVYLGSLVTSASELAAGGSADANPWRTAFYWFGLAATLLVTVILTRVARTALRKALSRTESPSLDVEGVTP